MFGQWQCLIAHETQRGVNQKNYIWYHFGHLKVLLILGCNQVDINNETELKMMIGCNMQPAKLQRMYKYYQTSISTWDDFVSTTDQNGRSSGPSCDFRACASGGGIFSRGHRAIKLVLQWSYKKTFYLTTFLIILIIPIGNWQVFRFHQSGDKRMLITLPNRGDDSISKITLSLMLTSSDHTPSDQGLLGFTMGFIMV